MPKQTAQSLDPAVAPPSGFWRSCVDLWLLIVWPFVYLWSHLISGGVHPGNDFQTLYYPFKLYLLDLMARGLPTPVWSPSEACGFPFRANPFVAAHYPLNHVLAEFYLFQGGYSENDHVRFTISAFSIFAIGVYVWLRSMGESRNGSLLAGLVLSTSLKLTELMRFPNAAHAAAWIPWLLLGVTLSFRSRKQRLGSLVCAWSSYCLLTAGYPYFVYYAQFLIGPFCLILMIPALRRSISLLPESEWASLKTAILAIAIGCGTALASCVSYLREMQQMLAGTTDRTGGNWEYSTGHRWDLTDTLGSLVYPPRACTEGWYFFGIAALALMALFVWDAWSRSDEDAFRGRQFLKTWAAFWLCLTLITIGRLSPLFYVLWKLYPGFSSLRVWGRMNIILVPLYAWLLSRAWTMWEVRLKDQQPLTQRTQRRRLIFVGVSVVAVQLMLVFGTASEVYWTEYFRSAEAPLTELRHYLEWTAIGLVPFSIGLLLLCSLTKLGQWGKGLVSLLLIAFACGLETMGYGSLQWTVWQVGYHDLRENIEVPTHRTRGFVLPRLPLVNTVSLGSQFFLGVVPNWYFERYVKFLQRFVPRPELIAADTEQIKEVPGLFEMLGGETGQRTYLVPRLDYSTPAEFMAEARTLERESHLKIYMTDFDGDHLSVTLDSQVPGYLCYIDNWDPTWSCRVNGTKVEIELLMGTFKAVKLPAGKSKVTFSCTGD